MGLKRWDVQWDQFSRRSPKVWGMKNGSKLGSKVVGFFDIRQGEAWLSPLRTVTCSLRVAMMRSWSFGMWRLRAKNMGQTVDDFSVYFCLRENAQSHAKIIQRLHLYTLVWWFLIFWFDLCKMTLIGWSLCGTSSEGTFLWLVGSFQECQADPTGHGSWFSCWNCVDGLQSLRFFQENPIAMWSFGRYSWQHLVTASGVSWERHQFSLLPFRRARVLGLLLLLSDLSVRHGSWLMSPWVTSPNHEWYMVYFMATFSGDVQYTQNGTVTNPCCYWL